LITLLPRLRTATEDKTIVFFKCWIVIRLGTIPISVVVITNRCFVSPAIDKMFASHDRGSGFFQGITCAICGGRSGSGTGFASSFTLLLTIPPTFHIHPSSEGWTAGPSEAVVLAEPHPHPKNE
jgi:hypothetical protein